MSSFAQFLFGTDPKFQQLTRLSPEQQQGLSQYGDIFRQMGAPASLGQSALYGQGSDYLSNLYGQSPEAFERFKAPYMRQFQQETVPGLAERFGSMGSGGGATSSSGFQQALARAGEGLSTNLASQMEGLKANLLPQLLGYAQAPFNQFQQAFGQLQGVNPFENIYQQGTPGFLAPALAGVAGGFGGGFGTQFGRQLGRKMF